MGPCNWEGHVKQQQKKPDPLADRIRRQREARLAREAQQPRREERSYPVIGLDDEVPFGKHSGKLLRDVIDDDPGWVVWAIEEIKTFEISDPATDLLELSQDVRRPPRAWE